MTRMTGPNCEVMCNLTNTHTHTHEQSNDRGGRELEKNIPYCMGNVTKKAPPGCGIEYPVSGWISLLQTNAF